MAAACSPAPPAPMRGGVPCTAAVSEARACERGRREGRPGPQDHRRQQGGEVGEDFVPGSATGDPPSLPTKHTHSGPRSGGRDDIPPPPPLPPPPPRAAVPSIRVCSGRSHSPAHQGMQFRREPQWWAELARAHLGPPVPAVLPGEQAARLAVVGGVQGGPPGAAPPHRHPPPEAAGVTGIGVAARSSGRGGGAAAAAGARVAQCRRRLHRAAAEGGDPLGPRRAPVRPRPIHCLQPRESVSPTSGHPH